MNRTINELAASFAKREGVEALVLAGSAVTGFADEESDYDLYVYTREAVPVEFRAKLLKPRAARLELHNTFWEWSWAGIWQRICNGRVVLELRLELKEESGKPLQPQAPSAQEQFLEAFHAVAREALDSSTFSSLTDLAREKQDERGTLCRDS